MSKALLRFSFKPTKESVVSIFLVWSIIFAVSGIMFIFSPKSSVSNYSVAFFYAIWVGVSLLYAVRNGGLDSIGLPGKKPVIATVLGIALGVLLVTANNNTPEFNNATLIHLPFLSMVTLIVTGSLAAFCEVIMIMGYYYFSLEDSFGPIVSILMVALTWTVFHLILVFSPGSIPSTSSGLANYAVGIFIGSLVITYITYATKSILTGFLTNLLSNVFINWFRMSVSPQDVLIASNSFPALGLIMVLLCITGLFYVQKNSHLRNSIDQKESF